MGRPRVYPDEFRERAVRLLREWRQARGVDDGGIRAVSRQLNLNPETLRRWYLEGKKGLKPILGMETYMAARMSGFGGESKRRVGKDFVEHPDLMRGLRLP